jgi:hypothetical protein
MSEGAQTAVHETARSNVKDGYNCVSWKKSAAWCDVCYGGYEGTMLGGWQMQKLRVDTVLSREMCRDEVCRTARWRRQWLENEGCEARKWQDGCASSRAWL